MITIKVILVLSITGLDSDCVHIPTVFTHMHTQWGYSNEETKDSYNFIYLFFHLFLLVGG